MCVCTLESKLVIITIKLFSSVDTELVRVLSVRHVKELDLHKPEKTRFGEKLIFLDT